MYNKPYRNSIDYQSKKLTSSEIKTYDHNLYIFHFDITSGIKTVDAFDFITISNLLNVYKISLKPKKFWHHFISKDNYNNNNNFITLRSHECGINEENTEI